MKRELEVPYISRDPPAQPPDSGSLLFNERSQITAEQEAPFSSHVFRCSSLIARNDAVLYPQVDELSVTAELATDCSRCEVKSAKQSGEILQHSEVKGR